MMKSRAIQIARAACCQRAQERMVSCVTQPLLRTITFPSQYYDSIFSPTHVRCRGFAKAAKKGKGGGGGAKLQDGSSVDGPSNEEKIKDLLAKSKKNMNGAVLQFTRALQHMRPDKADAGMFDDLHVQAYGQRVPLSQVAQVSVSGTHSLTVTVYDPSLVQDINKSIENMNPVFSIREEVNALQVSFPKMTKETRAELVKAVKKQAEQARQHVRRVRQDAMAHAKNLKGQMSEDDIKHYQVDVQNLTDDASNEIGKLLTAKEKALMEV